MTLIDELKVTNYSIIDCLKTKGKSVKRNELIKEILKDDVCFFKMEKNEAFVVLKNLNISDDMLEDTYNELINKEEFYRLYNDGKINANDKDLKIKYEIYSNNLFNSEAQDIQNKKSILIEASEERWYQKIFSFFKKIFGNN